MSVLALQSPQILYLSVLFAQGDGQPLITLTPPASPKAPPRGHRRNVSDTSGYRMGGKGSAFRAYTTGSGDTLNTASEHKSKSATTSPVNIHQRYGITN